MFYMLKTLILSLSLSVLSMSALASSSPIEKGAAVEKSGTKTSASDKQQQGKGANVTKPEKNDSKAVEELVKKLKSIRTLSAQFNQEVLADNGRRQVLSGELQLKRPSMFRWVTKQPYSQEIVTRDDKVWNVDHDLMQVVIQKQDTESENTPVQLLSGDAREFLKNYYVVVNDYRGDKTYSLRPTGNDALFDLLEIHFKKGELTGFSMTDSMGGRRKVDLQQVNINGMISNSRFRASYPKSYDVIDEISGS